MQSTLPKLEAAISADCSKSRSDTRCPGTVVFKSPKPTVERSSCASTEAVGAWYSGFPDEHGACLPTYWPNSVAAQGSQNEARPLRPGPTAAMLRALLVVAALNLGSPLVLNENSGSQVAQALTKGNTTQGEGAETEPEEVSDTDTEPEGAEMLSDETEVQEDGVDEDLSPQSDEDLSDEKLDPEETVDVPAGAAVSAAAESEEDESDE